MLRRTVPPVLRRAGFRVAHRVLRVYWLMLRPRKHGVKCVVLRGDEVLLVRHTYGDRDRWELPGGAVKSSESPRQAARREVEEELGLSITDWVSLGELFVRLNRRRDTLHCFVARAAPTVIDIDRGEIAEARWFARDQLPPRLGRYVRRILSLAAAGEPPPVAPLQHATGPQSGGRP